MFLVIAGRAKVTTRNFPASLVGLAVNVGLLFALVPGLGITGAGLALCGAYLAMLTVMHLLTRRAFAVDFEWARIVHLSAVFAAVAVAGELLAPTHGAAGLLIRAGARRRDAGDRWPPRASCTTRSSPACAGSGSAASVVRRASGRGPGPAPVGPRAEPGTT